MITDLKNFKSKNAIISKIKILCKGYGKPEFKFIHQIVLGSIKAGSSKLSDIGRKLQEGTTLKKIIERLGRNLEKIDLTNANKNYLESIKLNIHEETIISVDDGDICKDYANKMEHLSKIRDASSNEYKNGYYCNLLFAINGIGKPDKTLIPLLGSLYSTWEETYLSKFDEIKKLIKKIVKYVGAKGIYVLDRGFDRRSVFDFLLGNKLNFVIRMTSKRNITTLRGKIHNILDFARLIRCSGGKCKVSYTNKNGELKVLYGNFGSRKVIIDKEIYTLVVIRKYNGKIGAMYLTNLEVKTRKDLFKVIEIYNHRWVVEDAFRQIKQSFQIERVMLKKFKRTKNLYNLMILTTGLIGIIGFDGYLKNIATYLSKNRGVILKEAKYYICDIINGLKELLNYYKIHTLIKGLYKTYFRNSKNNHVQLSILSLL